jgi:hypothetical protein
VRGKKKATAWRAGLTAFWGVNCMPGGMAEADALMLALHRPAAERRRRLDERVRAGARVEPDEVYDVVFAETGDAQRAGDAATRWAEGMLRREEA